MRNFAYWKNKGNMKTNFFYIFGQSFLSAFGLADNPINELRKQQKSDSENIANDWMMIGNDIRKAYETATKTTC
jgi:dimeric dUTPase (all-alpha-NTP-PPase superfamily)